MGIPNRYHFIFFNPAPAFHSRPFLFIHYLTIVACQEINRPDAINFYCDREPSGVWWERARPYLRVIHLEPAEQIYGIHLQHPAHKADVARLQILLRTGGIYLDLDVLCLRSFAPLLTGKVVMGEEYNMGLCNAVILASPDAAFLKRWISCYRTFLAKDWNYHSVQLPKRLATAFPAEIQVLDHRKFFWPMYWPEHLEAFFRSPGSTFCTDSFCVHLWQTLSSPYLEALNPRVVWETDSEFCGLARQFIDPALV